MGLFNQAVLLDVIFHAPSIGAVVGLAVLLLLLAMSAFISGSESAFFSLKPSDLHHMQEHQSEEVRYRLGLEMLNNQDRLLATILITNNLVNVGIVILSNYVTDTLVTFSNSAVAAFLVKMVAITFLLLLFGEIMPKHLGASRPLAYAGSAARILYGFYLFWGPIAKLLARSVSRMNQRFTPRVQLSMDELGEALEITKGHLQEEEAILKRIVTYGHIEVCEIMRPRLDTVAVEKNTDYNTLKETVLASGYSRVPVYEDTLDTVVGILYVKDLLQHIDEPSTFDWFRLVRKAYFVPENKRINHLFAEIQRNHIHMAIVVDEYGGTCGVITLEDILEEIFGEIGDESDATTELYTKINDHSYRFQAKIQLNDLCKILEIDDAIFDDMRGEAETLGGLILEVLGEFPKRNAVLEVAHLRLTVEAVSKRRIETVRVDL